MRRVAFGLVLSLVITTPALAEGWRRVSAGGEAFWVSGSDLDAARTGGPKRVRILDLNPPHKADGPKLAYRIIERTYSCAAGGLEDVIIPFGERGERMDSIPTPQIEVEPDTPAGALFQVVCDGAEPYSDVELGSVREVVAWVARNGDAGPDTTAGDWSGGGSGLTPGGGYFDEGESEPVDTDFEPAPEEFEEPGPN